MKKKVGIIKQLLCIGLVFLIQINSFAAIVSDNDGSAFITKAEFDALKNSFQTQIDTYNTSIDSKIDGAIAQYLAGVSFSNKVNRGIINNAWGKVVGLNFVPDTNFKPFAYNGSYQWYSNIYIGDGAWVRTQWAQNTFCNVTVASGRDLAESKRFICNSQKPSGANVGDIVEAIWGGRALNVDETLNLSISDLWVDHGYKAGLDAKVMTWVNGYQNYDCYLTYYASFIDCVINPAMSARQLWQPQFFWYAGGSLTADYHMYTNNTPTQTTGTVAVNIDVSPNSAGNVYDYEHIITWDNSGDFKMTDLSWNTCLRSEGTLTRNDLPRATVTGTWSGTETNSTAGTHKEPTSLSGHYKKAYGVDNDTTLLPSIGYIGSINASKIIQTDNILTENINGKTFTTEKDLISAGLPIMFAKKGERIIWKPKFIDTRLDGSLSNYDIELRLKVNEKFGVGFNPAGFGDLLTTTVSGGSGNVEFEMPEDGIIYCKWAPSDFGYRTAHNWESTLDLTNCSTYEVFTVN